MFEAIQLSDLKFKETLDALRGHGTEDFNGHTEFHRMSAQQRLAWLDGAVAFIKEAKNSNRQLIQDSEIGKT
jgi:hypothetical protein